MITLSHPRRDHWQRRTAALDPQADATELYRTLAAHEFPWDVNQSLSLALFRTYAVPSIGETLFGTGEFTERTQKRYDDTVLIMGEMVEHGLGHDRGRRAVRRMNQMHRAHAIGQDDLRYVLCTFVVVPARWMADLGWRPLSRAELDASAHHYRELGRHMGITDLPETFEDFAAHQDAYEAQHFAYSPGGRAVADATLDLMTTFPPFSRLPARVVRRTALSLMDAPLLRALGYPEPSAAERAAVRAPLLARARVERLLPPRLEPVHSRDLPTVRGYPDGFRVEDLGTCPVAASGE